MNEDIGAVYIRKNNVYVVVLLLLVVVFLPKAFTIELLHGQ